MPKLFNWFKQKRSFRISFAKFSECIQDLWKTPINNFQIANQRVSRKNWSNFGPSPKLVAITCSSVPLPVPCVLSVTWWGTFNVNVQLHVAVFQTIERILAKRPFLELLHLRALSTPCRVKQWAQHLMQSAWSPASSRIYHFNPSEPSTQAIDAPP